MISGGGIRVVVGEEGIALFLVASDGREIACDMLQLAGEFDGEDRKIIVQWCRDRLKDASARDLPANVRQWVEAEIDKIAKR